MTLSNLLGIATDMRRTPIESLFLRYRDQNDLEALAAVFDRTAPHLVAIARRLDPNHAEDLLQETFLAAIQNATQWNGARPLSPWLLGILTRRAQRSWESKQRTPDPHRLPERQVEAPEARPMAREFKDGLDQAISALSPPLRQAVEACLIDGQSPTQLAVDLGLRSGTVRQRLSRGLGELRHALRGAIVLLFGLFGLQNRGVAAVRTRILQTAAGGEGLAAVSGSPLGARWALAGLIVSATMIASITWHGQAANEPDVTPRQGLSAIDPQDRPMSNSQTKLRSPGTQPERENQPETRTFQVQVLHSITGDTVPGRDVELRLLDKEMVRATTDQQGLASFKLLPDQKVRSAQALCTPTSPPIRAFLAESDPSDILILRVDDGGSLSGVVLDPAGKPVADASVSAWFGYDHTCAPDREVQTNPVGEFTLRGLGPKFIITATKGDEWVTSLGLRGGLLARDALTGHQVLVAEPGTMRGAILHPDGRPVPGIELTVSHKTHQSGDRDLTHDAQVSTFMAGIGRTTSDESGAFEIHGLPPGNHLLRATLTPYHMYSEYHGLEPEQVRAEFSPGHSLSGTVTDPNGQAIDGVEIAYWPYYSNKHTTPYWNACTDELGSFTLNGMCDPVSDGHNVNRGLIVRAPGFAIHAIDQFPADLGELGQVHIKLLPEKSIEGVVLQEDGTPAEGFLVRIEGDRHVNRNLNDGTPHTWENMAGRNTDTTDADGRFRFEGLYPGSFQVKVFADRSKTHFLEQTARSGHASLSFHMTTTGLRKVVILPVVKDALTGEAIDDFELTHWIGGSGRTRPLKLGHLGMEASGIEPGTFGLDVGADRYVATRIDDKHYGVGEHVLTFELYPKRSLQFKCVDERGKPVPSFRISGTGPKGRAIQFESGLHSTSTHLNVHNSFVHGVPAGKVRLSIQHGDASAEMNLDLSMPLEQPIEVTLSPIDRAPVFNVRLHLLQRRKMAEGSKEDNHDGYLFCPENPFTIEVVRPNGLTPIRIKYGPESDLVTAVDLAETQAKNSPSLDPPVGEPVGPQWTLSVPVKNDSYSVRPKTWADPLVAGFATEYGPCSLRLISDHYEPVNLSWTARDHSTQTIHLIPLDK